MGTPWTCPGLETLASKVTTLDSLHSYPPVPLCLYVLYQQSKYAGGDGEFKGQLQSFQSQGGGAED